MVVLLWRNFVLRGEGPVRRPIVDLALASRGGAACRPHLSFPASNWQTRPSGTRAVRQCALPASQVLGVLFQSFWGQPIAGSFVNGQGFYQEEWVYVGAIALALSVVAVGHPLAPSGGGRTGRRGLVAVAASIFEPADDLLNKLPFIGHAWWSRSLIPLAFCLAMLAGVGLDAVDSKSEQRRAARRGIGAFAAIAVILVLVWLFGGATSPRMPHAFGRRASSGRLLQQ